MLANNENVCEIEKKNVRSCIDKNELILGNVTYVEWLWNREIKKNVPIFVLVGVSHRLTQSTKVYVDWERKLSALKKWNVNGVVILGSCSFHQRAAVRSLRRICVMLYVAGVAVDVLASG